MERTRLAPSPTGALHLGNARTFLINWALARQRNWQILLRIDDLDGPRIKVGADLDAMETLRWLGIDWDDGPVYQTAAMANYENALRTLSTAGRIYPCQCTRSQIQAASMSAPHAGEHELRYPGTCRTREGLTTPFVSLNAEPSYAWRIDAGMATWSYQDQFAGPQAGCPGQEVGDFLVSTKQGVPSYQLAVVVDDHRQAITAVVRGGDLMGSTFRQLLIYEALAYRNVPRYWHLPIVVGEDGRRLAKRHGDSRVAFYRDQGVRPERVLGLLAEWCGCGPRAELTATEFLSAFRLETVPRTPITFHPADDAWLRGK